jgi:hypothetical protein
MSWKNIVFTGLLCVVASTAWADPQIRVIQNGMDGGNQKWKVQVQPDGPLLWSNPQLAGAEGASLALQLDLTFSSAVVTAAPTSALPDLNNGNNPFLASDAVSEGIAIDGSTVYAAVGGPYAGDENAVPPIPPDPLFMPFPGDTNMDNTVFSSDFSTLAGNWDPLHTGAGVTNGRADGDFNSSGFVDSSDFSTLAGNWNTSFWIDVLDVTTTGAGGTVSWGGQTVLDGTAQEFTSSRIAQAGVNFDGISGSSGAGSLGTGAVPEPASLVLLVCGTLMLGGRRFRR